MKNKILISTALLIAFAFSAWAQENYPFKVLVNKGKNEVKSGEVWQLIKTGSSLKSADELRLAENAYVGLIHVSGKPLELKQAGKYRVVDLAGKVSGGSSVLNKYTDFILSSNTQKKNNLSATGAVHRGIENVKVYLPKAEVAIVFNNNVIINWDTAKVPAPYIVTFSSMFGEELNRIETKDNNVVIDLGDNNFLHEDNILVKVFSKVDPQNNKSVEYTLKKLSRADKDRIKTLYDEIKDQVADKSAMSKYVLAGFYEKNGLFIDAITSYQEAIKLAPEVPWFKESFNDFLIRNAIIEPPIK